ncbi:ABC transporter permease [Prosthecomicrobium pneumaticum]|uniref:NitT/TauT family transport system permease protein n=1 Tax=Prosthecomicrobium pneumaticum TaxID=81895 RepID=A0A7W9L2J8_9HYPH|nr:ABC transporter permease [Prosthecomicrobium pneumaticum]MBB5753577.1 NitT/TauT family transport system permease protein [Prosthecomicrobium pneumaticum]
MAAITEAGADARPKSPLRFLSAVSPAIWTLIALVIFWEIAVRVTKTPVFILPAPSRIAEVFAATWPRLMINAGLTLSEVLIGFSCAVAIGVPLAVLITYSRLAERCVYPLIVASQTIPKVAIAPLMLAWFGYGLTPKVVIVILLSFFPIVINAVVGLKSSTAEMLYLAQSMGASGWQTFWKFRLPQALPNIFAGLKLATVLSVIGAVVAEFIGADQGLGYLIVVAGASFDIARQFAAIIMISAIGMVFFAVIELAERIVVPWRDTNTIHAEA